MAGFFLRECQILNLIEFKLRELKKKVDEAKGAAESASNLASFAAAVTESSAEPSKKLEKSIRSITGEGAENDPLESLTALSKEYDYIRKTRESGATRTKEMTAIVRKMVDLGAFYTGL